MTTFSHQIYIIRIILMLSGNKLFTTPKENFFKLVIKWF